ncbi:hypothetical protein GJAV_G00223540 [Gymnothorax javanicus]|nr:hypothetical protein GJAV_G00223540 [Gymnothorax javanicus]
MAACSMNTVRVRLYFDYPPPAVSDCRMCWVLVDLNKCRVVADLASVIKEKFDFSRRTILNLFIEDCYLPPTESIYVVRDNDSIRVKVENQPYVNGIEAEEDSKGLSQKASKRLREMDDENEGSNIKKRKKALAEGLEVDPGPQPVRNEAQEKKKKKKKRKKKVENVPVKAAAPMKRTTPAKDPAVSKSGKTTKNPAAPAAKAPRSASKPAPSSSSSDSSDSSEDEPPKKVVAKASIKPGGGVTAAVPASSSSSESSSDSASAVAKPGPKNSAPPALEVKGLDQRKLQTSSKSSASNATQPASKKSVPNASTPAAVTAGMATHKKLASSSSDSDSSSSSETPTTNKRPGLGLSVPQPSSAGPSGGHSLDGVPEGRGFDPRGVGRGQGSPGAGRGVGRGDGRFPWRGGGGSGLGGGHRGGPGRPGRGAGNHLPDQNGLQQQHENDTLTNKAVILQNPPEHAPKRDYASMPLLAAPPQVGQKIAFKLLELTENYTPEVSDYKEGKIIGIDQSTNQVELELLSSAPAPTEPGKFDLVYQTPDGSEIVEYAVSRASQLTERWESLLEPRLIVENSV